MQALDQALQGSFRIPKHQQRPTQTTLAPNQGLNRRQTTGGEKVGLAAPARAAGIFDPDAPLPAGGLDLEAVERSLIERALRDTRGNKSKASRLLGLTRAQLYSRLEKYSLG